MRRVTDAAMNAEGRADTRESRRVMQSCTQRHVLRVMCAASCAQRHVRRVMCAESDCIVRCAESVARAAPRLSEY